MPSENSSLAAALDRTRRSYDDTPYVHAPMMRSHPGRLAAQAVWRGRAAPDAAKARVLEIGCASGGNLLPLAALMPDAGFLGVDLSPVQIAAGEARRRRYGLANVELRADSFEALGPTDGAFDYIICHGVYSWIPEPLRESLMRVIAERLAPDGVAMVSFNVLPGWRLFQIARDSMLLHARMGDPAQRAQRTRELFTRLAAESANKHTYGKFWRDEATHMAAGGDAYLAHEIFEDSNAPETFADFAGRAGRFGLDYLGEAAAVANNEAELAPEGAQSIRALSEGDRLKRESYIDIFSGRSFREALLVHSGRADAIAEPALESLHYIPALELGLAVARDAPGVFRLSIKETELFFQDSRAEPAIRRLLERRPASSRLADLVEGADAELRDEIRETLRIAVEAGLLAASTLPVDCAVQLDERPKIWPLAAIDAADSDHTATLRHSAFTFASFQRLLAPLVDGTRTRDELVAAAVDMAAKGELTLNGPDGPVTDPQELRARLATATDNALAGLWRNGLLVVG
jgi:SAM-dependent methyltransferase